jgi:hypothetical protein
MNEWRRPNPHECYTTPWLFFMCSCAMNLFIFLYKKNVRYYNLYYFIYIFRYTFKIAVYPTPRCAFMFQVFFFSVFRARRPTNVSCIAKGPTTTVGLLFAFAKLLPVDDNHVKNHNKMVVYQEEKKRQRDGIVASHSKL